MAVPRPDIMEELFTLANVTKRFLLINGKRMLVTPDVLSINTFLSAIPGLSVVTDGVLTAAQARDTVERLLNSGQVYLNRHSGALKVLPVGRLSDMTPISAMTAPPIGSSTHAQRNAFIESVIGSGVPKISRVRSTTGTSESNYFESFRANEFGNGEYMPSAPGRVPIGFAVLTTDDRTAGNSPIGSKFMFGYHGSPFNAYLHRTLQNGVVTGAEVTGSFAAVDPNGWRYDHARCLSLMDVYVARGLAEIEARQVFASAPWLTISWKRGASQGASLDVLPLDAIVHGTLIVDAQGGYVGDGGLTTGSGFSLSTTGTVPALGRISNRTAVTISTDRIVEVFRAAKDSPEAVGWTAGQRGAVEQFLTDTETVRGVIRYQFVPEGILGLRVQDWLSGASGLSNSKELEKHRHTTVGQFNTREAGKRRYAFVDLVREQATTRDPMMRLNELEQVEVVINPAISKAWTLATTQQLDELEATDDLIVYQNGQDDDALENKLVEMGYPKIAEAITPVSAAASFLPFPFFTSGMNADATARAFLTLRMYPDVAAGLSVIAIAMIQAESVLAATLRGQSVTSTQLQVDVPPAEAVDANANAGDGDATGTVSGNW